MKNKKNISTIAIVLTVLLAFSALLVQVNAADSSLIVSAKLPWKLAVSAAIWDGANAYIFGGGNEEGAKNTIIKYNTANNQVSISSATLPDSITDAGAIYDGRYAYLFSGWTPRTGGNSGKIVRYDPVSDSVTVMKATVPTYSMSAVWNGRYAYLFGGWNGYSYYNQILRYDPVKDEITTMSAKFPKGIKWTSAVWTGTYAYIFGGSKDYAIPTDEIFRYDPVADSLTVMTAKLPAKLYFTSAVWTGTYALIFGGDSYPITPVTSDKIIKYEPASDAITIMDKTLPTPRWGTSAIWSGDAAYIFGGNNEAIGDIAYDDIIKYTPAQQLSPVQSDLLSLPAYAYDHAQPYALRTESFAGAQLLSVSQQTVSVSPGQSVSIDVTYQVYSTSNLGAIMQLFFAESWAPVGLLTTTQYPFTMATLVLASQKPRQ